MGVFTKINHWARKRGLFVFLLAIFVIFAVFFNLLGLVVGGLVDLAPTIVSLLVTLFVWIGLSGSN